MRAIRAMVLVAAALSAGGCHDAFGPWGTTGTYALRSANGQGLPAVLLTVVGDGSYTVSLVGGEIRLRGDHTFRLELDYLERDRRSDVYYTHSITGTWEREGDLVFFDYTDPVDGHWTSVAGVRRDYDDLELTILDPVSGLGVRTVFDR